MLYQKFDPRDVKCFVPAIMAKDVFAHLILMHVRKAHRIGFSWVSKVGSDAFLEVKLSETFSAPPANISIVAMQMLMSSARTQQTS